LTKENEGICSSEMMGTTHPTTVPYPKRPVTSITIIIIIYSFLTLHAMCMQRVPSRVTHTELHRAKSAPKLKKVCWFQ